MIRIRVSKTYPASGWDTGENLIMIRPTEREGRRNIPLHLVLAHEIAHTRCHTKAGMVEYARSAAARSLFELEAWTWAIAHNPILAEHRRIILYALRTYHTDVAQPALYSAFEQMLYKLHPLTIGEKCFTIWAAFRRRLGYVYRGCITHSRKGV